MLLHQRKKFLDAQFLADMLRTGLMVLLQFEFVVVQPVKAFEELAVFAAVLAEGFLGIVSRGVLER